MFLLFCACDQSSSETYLQAGASNAMTVVRGWKDTSGYLTLTWRSPDFSVPSSAPPFIDLQAVMLHRIITVSSQAFWFLGLP